MQKYFRFSPHILPIFVPAISHSPRLPIRRRYTYACDPKPHDLKITERLY